MFVGGVVFIQTCKSLVPFVSKAGNSCSPSWSNTSSGASCSGGSSNSLIVSQYCLNIHKFTPRRRFVYSLVRIDWILFYLFFLEFNLQKALILALEIQRMNANEGKQNPPEEAKVFTPPLLRKLKQLADLSGVISVLLLSPRILCSWSGNDINGGLWRR